MYICVKTYQNDKQRKNKSYFKFKKTIKTLSKCNISLSHFISSFYFKYKSQKKSLSHFCNKDF